MAELDVAHLSLRFGGLTVLDDVSFSVGAGELFALIGPNGAGKTSALNCISGIYRGSGAIRFRGEDIAGRAPHEIRAARSRPHVPARRAVSADERARTIC
jgi:branched-chain amino acid transport system ATP-binding protein